MATLSLKMMLDLKELVAETSGSTLQRKRVMRLRFVYPLPLPEVSTGYQGPTLGTPSLSASGSGIGIISAVFGMASKRQSFQGVYLTISGSLPLTFSGSAILLRIVQPTPVSSAMRWGRSRDHDASPTTPTVRGPYIRGAIVRVQLPWLPW